MQTGSQRSTWTPTISQSCWARRTGSQTSAKAVRGSDPTRVIAAIFLLKRTMPEPSQRSLIQGDLRGRQHMSAYSPDISLKEPTPKALQHRYLHTPQPLSGQVPESRMVSDSTACGRT